MEQTIYIDVLVGLNLFINYFMLKAAAKYLAAVIKKKRLIAASGLGALFSLVILLPETGFFISLLMRLGMSIAIVLTAFGWHGIRSLIRCTAAFYIIGFAFAGLMLVLWYLVAPQGMLMRNSIVYFDISPLLLVVFTVISYILISIAHRFTGRQMPKELNCRIVIRNNGCCCICSAKVDTGNSLREPFSGDPVVVVYEKAVSSVMPPPENSNIRLVPFSVVSGNGLLRAFRPERLTVYSGKRIIETKKVFIAVSEERLGESDALLNPDILQEIG